MAQFFPFQVYDELDNVDRAQMSSTLAWWQKNEGIAMVHSPTGRDGEVLNSFEDFLR